MLQEYHVGDAPFGKISPNWSAISTWQNIQAPEQQLQRQCPGSNVSPSVLSQHDDHPPNHAYPEQILPSSLLESPTLFRQRRNSQSRCGDTVASDPTLNVHEKAISVLQEFVQCSKYFRCPSNRSILQWAFEERSLTSGSFEFCATVAFLFDGFPHHVVGTWKQSKILAKRDAAERTLQFFVGRWGAEAVQWLRQSDERRCKEVVTLTPTASGEIVGAVEVLERYCESEGYTKPVWHLSWVGDVCKAMVEIRVKDVPHHFDGQAWSDEESAYNSTAARVLYYFKCPGFEDLIELDPHAPAATEPQIPAPPTNWMRGDQNSL